MFLGMWGSVEQQVSWQEVPEFEKAPIAAKSCCLLCWQLHCREKSGVASLLDAIATMRQWWHPLKQEGPRSPTWLICSDAYFSLRPSQFAVQLPHHIFQAS